MKQLCRRRIAISYLAGVLLLGGSAAQAKAPRAVAAFTPELTWTLKKTTVNPRGEAQPVGSSVVAKSGSLTWQILYAPQVQYDVTYPAPAAQLKPSQKLTLPVTVSGRVTGGKDTGGYRKIDVIGYLNDRWDNDGPGLWQNCTAPSWGAPIACMPPATVKGKISFFAPQPSRAGDTFSWGVGALNCSACYVRFEYVAKEATVKLPPSTMGSARLRMKAEATSGAKTMFPSYVQTYAGGDIDFSRKTGVADGTFVFQHEFALDAIPDWKLVLDVTGVERYAVSRGSTAVEFRATVRTSSFSGCKYGTSARIILLNGSAGVRDTVAIGVCGDFLKFVHGRPDAIDRVTVTIKRPA